MRYINHNPTDHMSLPEKPERQPIILEPEEVVRVLNLLSNHRLFPLFATEFTTGLRISELTGLRWSDIDLEGGKIRVVGQIHWLKNKPVWVPSAKTKAGQRDIYISGELIQILSNWRQVWEEERAFLGDKWRAGDYIFTNQGGHIIQQPTIRQTLKRTLRAAELDTSMTFHDLRHTAGSLMLAAGEEIRAVSELLGHSSVAITETIYAHALKKSKKTAGQSLGYLLNS